MSKLLEKLRKDAEKVKGRKEERESGQFDRVEIFKPEKGDNIIRVMPHWSDEDELPYVDVRIHFGVPVKNAHNGNTYNIPVRCLKDFGQECPCCDASESTEDKEMQKNYRATERYIYNILNYKNKRVEVYTAPTTVHEEFAYWGGDIGPSMFSMDKGRNFKLTKTVKPGKAAMYGTEYAIRPDMKESAVPKKLVDLIVLNDLSKQYDENHLESMCDWVGLDVEDYEVKEKPKASKKATKKAAAKKAAPKKKKPEPEESEEDDEVPSFDTEEEIPMGGDTEAEEADVESEDDDLDAELARLGV